MLALVTLCSAFGCWEQLDGGQWFPQMKRQLAVQPFEEVIHADQGQGFSPPDGAVPVDGGSLPPLRAMSVAQQDALPNPVPASLSSLKKGELLFQRYCAICHGPEGAGDGPVAGAPFGEGPFGMVLPIGGPLSVAKNLSDGHIYTTISIGSFGGRGRMPSYQRILHQERWDIVNFLREVNGQGAGR